MNAKREIAGRVVGSAVVAIVAVALLAAGCGDGNGTDATGPSTTVPASSTTPTTDSPATIATSTSAPVGARPTVVDEVLRGGSDAEGHTYELTFPQVRGLADAAVQDAIDAEIRAQATSLVDEFVAGVREFPAPPADLAGQQSGLTGTYEVSRLDDALASFRLRVSRFFAGAAHPGASLHTFNYDVTTGKRLALADLFTAGSPYLAKLSELSRQLLAAQPGFADLESFVQPGTEPTAENFDNWTLTDQDLVVTFDEYQVAPYAMGTPHVSIPFGSLRLLLDPAGPLATYN